MYYYVLSSTVANRLKVHFPDTSKETSHFVRMFDKFFDALNVTNYSNSITSLKPFKMPYSFFYNYCNKRFMI